MKSPEKPYVDSLDAQKLLDLSFFKPSFEFRTDQNRFLLTFHRPCCNSKSHASDDNTARIQQYRKFISSTRA